jgi:UDP:flavonoid glycosyltransferase YjiC (YdhE family)
MTVRVLIASTPGTGHLHPLVPIAHACVARGNEVRWAVASDAVERVASYGFDAVPAGLTIRERFERFSAIVDLRSVDPPTARPVFFNGLFADVSGPIMREQLGPIVDDFRPDVIVHDLAELASPAVAAARGVPSVTVAFSGEVYPAIVDHARPSVDRLWAAEGLPPARDFGWFDHLYLHPWPDALGHRPDHSAVVSSWHMGFDGGGGDVPGWVEALGRERPCVYVTFGTEMGPMAPWPALMDALGQMDADVVVTTGVALDLSSPPNVRVERYVPQRFVLDRASLVISHCGSGTLAAALERGLPQLALPLGADQFDNARASAAAGVGVTLAPSTRTSLDILDATRTVLGDPVMRARCAVVREELAGMIGPSEAAERIEALVR